MSNTRIVIKEAEIVSQGILITEIEIIDSISGERIKPANLTPELLDFLKCIEIEIDAYFEIQEAKKKNPNFTKLIDTFKLFT